MVLCFKCGRSQGVASSRDGAKKPYCAECFVEFCTRHIRDNLFKHCGVPCEVPLVVAVSGGPGSMALLHQLGVLRMQNRMRPKRGQITFTFIPLHLREDELVVPLLSDDAESHVGGPQQVELRRIADAMTGQFEKLEKMIRTQCVQWEFGSVPLFTTDEVCVVRYSDYLSPSEMRVFRAALHHPRLPLTQREFLYGRLRQRVLTAATIECISRWHQARDLLNVGWYHILTGENALRCCVTTFRELMSGNGENFVHHCGHRGFVSQCLVLRPLRSLLPRELVLYCHTQGIWAGYSPSLSTKTSLRSMNRTLELFFNNMLQTYHTSVFNVLNTVNKLHIETAPELTSVELQIGVSPQQTKRVIPGKTAQHHYEQLQMKQLPHYSWFGRNDGMPSSSENDDRSHHLCLLCGCTIPTVGKHVILLQAEGRLFMCNACITFVQGLPDDVITVVPSLNTTEHASSDKKLSWQTTKETDSDLLGVFLSLAMRMESLMRTAVTTPETSREADTVETRRVRRRLSEHDVRNSLLEKDGEDEELCE
ncbi:cytoplasmic tRNA 2-thiolation protein 2 [Trypanosoma rangeli]|uniref:Cytoplasmic tRNA 2-thiolation protein 2 n=1 Tax=Trypanosoma rangeli TaxID=5698 RepID=A0A422NGF6_TRYRA|nr:cytoplasmic tRNA 2-thiolation protein 2 [Trypanosoma rangeli]RNF04544.1 cytoplasmic tRNA 2-thiolation protein 2 [Trypanosoma rangeli]|eukprot:RNF04544.1 cytoplasmic tRNA 2-thiolation protein 2 [Trypanosoma rangeli]